MFTSLAFDMPKRFKKIDMINIIFFIVFLSLKLIKLKVLMRMIININDNDYQYQYVAVNATKKCIGAKQFYVYAWL
tara:strand:+ start:161 stop:388 length:228 start_codon:yes stop_codon:yes gene_type:complete